MIHHHDLTPLELYYLQRVAHGDLRSVATAPDAVLHLVALGLVEAAPSLSFPVLPKRVDYRLTTLGQQLASEHLLSQKSQQ